MADVVATVAPAVAPPAPAPAAPAVVPVAPVVATPAVAESPKTPTPREARRAARQELRSDPAVKAAQDVLAAVRTPAVTATEPLAVAGESPPAPKVDRQGKLHDPNDGTYVEKAQAPTAAAAPAAAGSEPTPAATPEPGQQDPAAAPAAGIKVEVPEGHFLRAQGVTELPATDEQNARHIRSMINATGARRAELDTTQAELAEVRRLLEDEVGKRINREAEVAARQKYEAMPEFQELRAQFFEIRNNHDGTPEGKKRASDAASAYWKGSAQVRIQELQQQELATRQEALSRDQEAKQRTEFHAEAKRRTSARLPGEVTALPNFNELVEVAMTSFEVLADRGHFDERLIQVPEAQRRDWLLTEFARHLGGTLTRDPAVVAAYKRAVAPKAPPAPEGVSREEHERALAEARRQGAEELRQTAASRRAAVPPHPLADAAPAAPGTVSAVPEQPDFSTMTPNEIKRHSRQAARQTARQLFGP